MSQILFKFFLPTTLKSLPTSCNACRKVKSHQFPFSSSHTHSSKPLHLVYSDEWGPTLIISREGFKYYVTFLDDYTRYTWWFPLVQILDVFKVFLLFQTHVEHLFQFKIVSPK